MQPAQIELPEHDKLDLIALEKLRKKFTSAETPSSSSGTIASRAFVIELRRATSGFIHLDFATAQKFLDVRENI
jgi:hypothetical protein